MWENSPCVNARCKLCYARPRWSGKSRQISEMLPISFSMPISIIIVHLNVFSAFGCITMPCRGANCFVVCGGSGPRHGISQWTPITRICIFIQQRRIVMKNKCRGGYFEVSGKKLDQSSPPPGSHIGVRVKIRKINLVSFDEWMALINLGCVFLWLFPSRLAIIANLHLD